MTTYYNEHDPYAAAWLRNLIAMGEIAPGVVDERDIRDIRPDELTAYTQCHFFAGIGVWSYALRQAGWSDDRPIWTGSCPCQPFSAAGKRSGVDDERHLWPHWHWLISQCNPPVVVGEQVASKDGLGWLDLVQADLEGTDYAFGASDLCAAGFGGAHIRQRLYFVGMDNSTSARRIGPVSRSEGDPRDEARLRVSSEGCSGERMADALHTGRPEWRTVAGHGSTAGSGAIGGLGNTSDQPRERHTGSVSGAQAAVDGERLAVDGGVPIGPEHAGTGMGGLADADGRNPGAEREQRSRQQRQQQEHSGSGDGGQPAHAPMLGRHPADWLFCRDGKWRPVEPGTFPLAHAAPARVGRLRAYGNALDAATAQGFVESVMDCTESMALLG